MIIRIRLLRYWLTLRNGPYLNIDQFLRFTCASVLLIGIILAILTIGVL